ncbi:MAG: TolC family protein [Burkholderiales bacterium]|nr:TolC family protein [Opitutaceae bacterium]
MSRSVLLATALLTAPLLLAEVPVVGQLSPVEALKPEPPAPAVPPTPAVPVMLNLDQALRFALSNNYAIRQARERLREQEGLIVEVRADALPNVTLDGNYSREDKSLDEGGQNNGGGGGDNENYQNWTVGIHVRQVLYAGGGVKAALDAASTTRTAAELDITAVVNDVLLDVRTRYADVLLNRERIEVQEQSVALLQEQLQTVKNRFEAGSVSQFEVLTAEVALANAQPDLISARNGFRIAVDALRQAIGYQASYVDSQRIPDFAGELVFTPVDYDLEASLSAARARRPELLRLEQLEKARESGVTVARSDYLPEVYLTGGYEGRKSRFSNSVSDSVDGWVAGVEGSWAIFDGARTRGRVAQARAQLNQARLSLSEQSLAVEVEVRRAISSLQEAAELAQAAAKVVEQATEALRLADVRYKNGAATQLDVLQARVALTQASLNRIEANYRHTIAVATLRRSIAETDTFLAPETSAPASAPAAPSAPAATTP